MTARAPFVACLETHPSGLLCALRKGHTESMCLAWDNTRASNGTPGVAVRFSPAAPQPWPGLAVEPDARGQIVGPVAVALPSPTEVGPSRDVDRARAQGFTGDPCTACGSLAVIRSGSCATCRDCGHAGGCG